MKYLKISFCILFFLIISFFFIFTIRNNEPFSNLERRKLATFPKFDIKKLASKDYLDNITNAFSDQLVFRNSLVKGYYLFQFQHYYGDVTIGNNGQMYSAFQIINKNYYTKLEKVMKDLNEVADEVNSLGAKFIFLSIPRKDAVMTDDLPSSYISSEEYYLKGIDIIKENINDSVYLMDAYDIFKSNPGINYYFSSDHHISPRGAELLYKEIIKYVNKKDKAPLYDLTNYKINKRIVNGSYNRQIGQSIKLDEEELELIPKYNLAYIRYDNDKKSNTPVFGKGNDYEIFMGGDVAFTVIDTNRKNLPNILYAGSSFTNILEAMSIPSFNKVVSVDYRHNTSGNDLSYYIKKYDIDYVVFVPSQSTDALSAGKIKEHLGR